MFSALFMPLYLGSADCWDIPEESHPAKDPWSLEPAIGEVWVPGMVFTFFDKNPRCM